MNQGGSVYFVSVERSAGGFTGSVNFGELTPGRKADRFSFDYDPEITDAIDGLDHRGIIRLAIGQAVSNHLFSHLSRPAFHSYDLDLSAEPYADDITFVEWDRMRAEL
jgi:hypothetical protein